MGILTAILTLVITPIVRKFAFFIGAVDYPDKRRVNKTAMPTIGGLSIYISFFSSLFFLQPVASVSIFPIFISATIIILTGIIDDVKDISPKSKVLGILIASLIIYFFAGIKMDMITIPLIGVVEFGLLSLPITLLWIMAITNSINLIDGLDGLASGISIIALSTMSIISFFFLPSEGIVVFIQMYTLIFAIVGFLPFNFNPAKIYLGDTGALFLGFMIAVFSLYGLKNVTLVSLIVPIVILGIPITDTLYAILRRYLNNVPMSSADKHHMHHRLMNLGLTHKQTVLSIYAVALIFSFIALLYPISTLLGSIIITIALLFGLELFVEIIGLVGENRRPLLNRLKSFADKINRKNKN
jgi:UDP-GlcNAc:undecaprenyl-phosphate GlcNAc-1-phosphate transferase